MRAKKSLGQHFLTNPQIAGRIVDALAIDSKISKIIEIGPGKGILTDHLQKREESLILIEKDGDLVEFLSKRYQEDLPNIIQQDFLKADLKVLSQEEFHLIGNFPYNISSQIVFKMLDNRLLIPQMVGMFQKEVALRLASGHGSKQYGILSVLLQTFYDVEILFHLEPGSFSPPPKVKSTVIRCLRKANVEMARTDEKHFRRVVKLAFGQRRKMIRNSLASMLNEKRSAKAESFLTLRPEQISIEEFQNLALLVSDD